MVVCQIIPYQGLDPEDVEPERELLKVSFLLLRQGDVQGVTKLCAKVRPSIICQFHLS